MAKVVYRGISYDTQERRDEIKAKQQTRWFNEICRGIGIGCCRSGDDCAIALSSLAMTAFIGLIYGKSIFLINGVNDYYRYHYDIWIKITDPSCYRCIYRGCSIGLVTVFITRLLQSSIDD